MNVTDLSVAAQDIKRWRESFPGDSLPYHLREADKQIRATEAVAARAYRAEQGKHTGWLMLYCLLGLPLWIVGLWIFGSYIPHLSLIEFLLVCILFALWSKSRCYRTSI